MVLSVTGFSSLMCVVVSRVCYERLLEVPSSRPSSSLPFGRVYPAITLTFLTGVLMAGGASCEYGGAPSHPAGPITWSGGLAALAGQP